MPRYEGQIQIKSPEVPRSEESAISSSATRGEVRGHIFARLSTNLRRKLRHFLQRLEATFSIPFFSLALVTGKVVVISQISLAPILPPASVRRGISFCEPSISPLVLREIRATEIRLRMLRLLSRNGTRKPRETPLLRRIHAAFSFPLEGNLSNDKKVYRGETKNDSDVSLFIISENFLRGTLYFTSEQTFRNDFSTCTDHSFVHENEMYYFEKI